MKGCIGKDGRGKKGRRKENTITEEKKEVSQKEGGNRTEEKADAEQREGEVK
jgi:hypothetical protein